MPVWEDIGLPIAELTALVSEKSVDLVDGKIIPRTTLFLTVLDFRENLVF